MRRVRFLSVTTALLVALALPALAEPWPYMPFDQPHELGNHFGTYQNYGGSPYFHDGIDLVTPQGGVATYSVSDGTVTHITYNDPYYSGIMIGEPIPGGIGWLYWHISSSTFQFDVGDPVRTNDFIGRTASWPVANFHHVHFNRVQGTGGYPWGWYIAIENPLPMMQPHTEPDAPTFPNTYQSSKFAFTRQGTGQILNAGALSGDVDIVSRIADVVGLPQWPLNPWRIYYRIDGATQSVPERNTVTFSGRVPPDGAIGAIYSITSPLITQGNYDARIYYFIVTNTDGDGVVETTDSNYFWDTDLAPPGDYWVYVRAEDCAGNAPTDSMMCTIAGTVDARVELPETSHDFGLVPVGRTETWDMTILNRGFDWLSIRSIRSSLPVFSVNRSHFYVAPHGSETVRVTFAPNWEMLFTGTLEIATNDPAHPTLTVALRGTGGDPSSTPVPIAAREAGIRVESARPLPGQGAEIQFSVAAAGELSARAHDASGRRVYETSLRAPAAGEHTWVWSGRDAFDRALPAGLYFVELRKGGMSDRTIVLLVR